jgi:hypothetical protein
LNPKQLESFAALTYVLDSIRPDANSNTFSIQLIRKIRGLFDMIWEEQSKSDYFSKIYLQILAKCISKFGFRLKFNRLKTLYTADVILLVHYGVPLAHFKLKKRDDEIPRKEFRYTRRRLLKIFRTLNYRQHVNNVAIQNCNFPRGMDLIVIDYTTCVG